MKSVEFCYWLQGFFELKNLEEGTPMKLDAEQTACVQKHLAPVFKHEIDPSYPKDQQAELNKLHGGSGVSGIPTKDIVLRC